MKKLNFGSGSRMKEGYVNADIQKGADVVFDFNEFPYPFKDNTFDEVYSRNVLEHLNAVKKTIDELWRICKPDATIEIIVPYYNCKGAYSDLDHTRFFNDTAFRELVDQQITINKNNRYEIVELKLVPTWIGNWIPFRNKLSLFIGGLISEMNIKLRVTKPKSI